MVADNDQYHSLTKTDKNRSTAKLANDIDTKDHIINIHRNCGRFENLFYILQILPKTQLMF